MIRLFFYLYSIILTVLSVIPASPQIGKTDKLNHFLAFFLFVILLRSSYKVTSLQGIILSITFGAVIEIIQLFIPYRSGEVLDLVADGIGAILGSTLFSILIRIKKVNKFDRGNKGEKH
ncbi:VanZ family protein [Desulfurobacterium crinifex]